jgi:hypothetical protein
MRQKGLHSIDPLDAVALPTELVLVGGIEPSDDPDEDPTEELHGEHLPMYWFSVKWTALLVGLRQVGGEIDGREP